jgi:hypothetical protein
LESQQIFGNGKNQNYDEKYLDGGQSREIHKLERLLVQVILNLVQCLRVRQGSYL